MIKTIQIQLPLPARLNISHVNPTSQMEENKTQLEQTFYHIQKSHTDRKVTVSLNDVCQAE